MTFRVTIIQISRLCVEVTADSHEEAKKFWPDGHLLQTNVIEAEVIDVKKVA